MTDATFPALPIDPRAVDRLERYNTAVARLHALDPLAYQRRFLHGLYVLARMRRLPSRFVKPSHPAAAVLSLDSARKRAQGIR